MDQEPISITPSLRHRWISRFIALVVLGYAWMGARIMEPRLILPMSIDQAVWYEGGKIRSMRSLSQFGPQNFRAWAQVFRQAKLLSPEMNLLGKFEPGLQLIVNVDNPRVYSVSDRRIEIGIDYAKSEGQILKAVVKAWLFQNAAEPFRSSQLRMEVASDVISGILRGSFHLSHPDHGDLMLPRIGNWLRFAKSFANSCGLNWMPLELERFCGSSDRLNPLTLRPLLAAMSLVAIDQVPPFERLDYAKAWIKGFKGQTSAQLFDQPESLVEIRDWVRGEALNLSRIEPQTMVKLLSEADLLPDSRLRTDLIVRMSNWRDGSDIASSKILSVVDEGDRQRLEPGGLVLKDNDLAALTSPVSVWADCGDPEVHDVISEKTKTKHVLFLPCPESRLVFSGFVQMGVGVFARENPDVPFAQLNRLALERAQEKKIVRPTTRLREFVGASGLSPLLGFDQATWHPPMRAYRVIGAIEAVEWYRPAPFKSSSR